MAQDPRFAAATPWSQAGPAPAPRETFGQVAQAANPQQADPQQNRNISGLPMAKKVAGPLRFSGATTALPTPGLDMGPAAGPAMSPRQQARYSEIMAAQPKTEAEVRAAADARAAESGVQPVGKYVTGGYTPIADSDLWGGGGFSGADPRAVGAGGEGPTAAPETPAPAAQGGKGGGATTGNPAADAAAAPFVPGGAQGGKGGQQPAQQPPTTQPPVQQPASPIADQPAVTHGPPNIVPAGDVGNTGVEGLPEGGFDDTGAYNPDLGDTGGYGGEPFNPNNSIPGVQTVKPNLADPHPKVAKRLAEYTAAGGDPNNFVVINNDIWKEVLSQYPVEQRNAMKKQMKDKFYADQIAALGRGRPGVQG